MLRSLIWKLMVRTSRSTGAVQGMFALAASTTISVSESPSVTSANLTDAVPGNIVPGPVITA